MPTYLRWIAALSTAVTVQLIFTLITYPLASSTTDASGNTVVEVTIVSAWILPLANQLIGVLAALWINDWIAKRYPKAP